MNEKIRKIIAFLILIITTNSVAAVYISQVQYDPLDESKGEFVELYNNNIFEVNISLWTIRTEASQKDATIPDGVILPPLGYFLVSDVGFSSSNNSARWPAADHEEPISLYNSNSGVAIVDSNGTIMDAVGWGDPAGIDPLLYETEPALPGIEGQSLLRIRDTGNNQEDFIATNPVFVRNNNSMTLIVNIAPASASNTSNGSSSSPITITNMSISPDDDDLINGIQITPKPGKGKKIKIDVTAIGAEKVFARLNGENKSLRKYSGVYKASFNMSYYLAPGVYTIEVTAQNGSEEVTSSIDFEYLPLIAMDIDSARISFINLTQGETSYLIGDSDPATKDKPTIKNIGNIELDLKLSGTDMKSDFNSINITNMLYSFSADFAVNRTLTDTQDRFNLSLGLNSLSPLSLGLFIPQGLQEGTYAGTMSIIAVES